MTMIDFPEEPRNANEQIFYCPVCREPVDDPLVCGDCAAIICRRCGTPLEKPDEMGIG